MIKDIINKNFLLLILFSFSIFLSHASIYNLEIRFLYLTSLLFIYFDIAKLKHFLLSNKFLIYILLVFCLYLHSSFFYFFDLSLDELNIKTLGQVIIFSFTLLIIFFYKNLILKNLSKIVDLFVISFVILIITYNINENNILVDTLFSCNMGFFYYTRFLFFENPHFAIISASILTYFFFYIKDYLDKKILFCFYILFFIFSIGSTTMTLTFFLCMVSSILTSLIFCRKKKKYSIYSLIILFIFINYYFFYGSNLLTKSKEIIEFPPTHITEKLCSPKNENIKKKIDMESRDVFRGSITLGKSKLGQIFKKDVWNLSVSIQIYSLYFAKNSIIRYPFGVGLNNYIYYRQIFDQEQTIIGEWPREKIPLKGWFVKTVTANSLPFNKHTGSNNLSKLIVEFGILGLILLCYLFYMLCSKKIDNPIKIIFFTLLINQIFIRGTGYFDNGFLIIVIFLFFVFFEKKVKKGES